MKDNKTIKIWNAENKKVIFQINLDQEIRNFKVKNEFIIVLLKNKIKVFTFRLDRMSNLSFN